MHVLRKDDDDWVKKCMESSMKLRVQDQGEDQRGPGKRLFERCQAHKLNKEDAMDRCKWRKVIKEVR